MPRRLRLELPDEARAAPSEAAGPRRWPQPKLFRTESAKRHHEEPGLAVGLFQVAFEVTAQKRSEIQPFHLRPITVGVESENDGEFCVRLAERAYAAEKFHRRTRHRGEEASPREHDAHAVREPGELGRKVLDRGPNVEKIRHPRTKRASRELSKSRGVGVYADEQPLGRLSRHRERETTVSGAQVDCDPAREPRSNVWKLVDPSARGACRG